MIKILSPPIYENQLDITSWENQLILCCARTDVDTFTIEKIKDIVTQNLDWNHIITTAALHKITPLLYHNLSHICPELLPQPVLAYLQQYFQANVRHNLFLTGELLKILNWFASAGISAIPIKGATLAVCAYQNLGLRQFHDIDILVHPEDAIAARDILIDQGYENTYKFTRQQEIARLKSPYCKDNNYYHKDIGIYIDFHWQLLQKYLSFPLNYQQLWQRHNYISLAGKTVLNLAPEDNILYLCVHGARDRWNRLQLISDITAVINTNPQLNWDVVIKQSQKLGCRKRFLLGMILAQDLLGVNLPEAIKTYCKSESELKFIVTSIQQNIFSQKDDFEPLYTKSLFDIKTRERWQDKMQYIFYQSILVAARSKGILSDLI
jgi:hypothetical protein